MIFVAQNWSDIHSANLRYIFAVPLATALVLYLRNWCHGALWATFFTMRHCRGSAKWGVIAQPRKI